MEIYNETIRDLITPSSEVIELREDPVKGVQIAGISEIVVESAKDILKLLVEGNLSRVQEATVANETSSRSHAIFQITCEQTIAENEFKKQVRVGKFSLVDLAGSERAAQSGNTGLRMKEGASINKSLLALGNCINMLHLNSTKGSTNHIPFRDSKLTRLLKDSLGGNCRTLMIANISPCGQHFEDSLNTLKYAGRIKKIKTYNELNVSVKRQSVVEN